MCLWVEKVYSIACSQADVLLLDARWPVNTCICIYDQSHVWVDWTEILLLSIFWRFYRNAFSPLTLLVGWQEGHPAYKKLVRYWRGYLSRARYWVHIVCIWPSWCHCHSLSLGLIKSRLVIPFWYQLTRVVLEKGSLSVCVCVCVWCVFSICLWV